MKRYVFVAMPILIMGILISNCALFGGGTLSAPQNVSASDGTVIGRIVINWDLVDGAEEYHLERSSNNLDFIFIDLGYGNSITAPPYTDTNILGSDTNIYYYRVTASKANGQKARIVSEYSDSDSGYVGLPLATLISNNTWVVGNASQAGDVFLYYFNSVSNYSYYIYWDDIYDGTIYNNDIQVSAYRPGLSDFYFTNVDHGYTSPQNITALDGTVFIRVDAPFASGNFAIKVSNN